MIVKGDAGRQASKGMAKAIPIVSNVSLTLISKKSRGMDGIPSGANPCGKKKKKKRGQSQESKALIVNMSHRVDGFILFDYKDITNESVSK